MPVTNLQRIIMEYIFIMIRFSLLFTMLTSGGILSGQISFPLTSDCPGAATIQLSPDAHLFRVESIPHGFGAAQEMNAAIDDSLWISREHHSSWLSWEAPFSGYLGFNLIPDSVKDDYDFLLFRDTAGLGCAAILSQALRPERSLISRNNPAIQSYTGLNGDRRVNHVAAGPGPSFGKAVKVKKGEHWIMLMDNVYDDGGAFELDFHYFYAPSLAGKVVSTVNDSPLVAHIKLIEIDADSPQEEMESTENGTFETDRLLEFEHTYRLVADCEGFFPGEVVISYQSLRSNRGRPLIIKLVENRPGAILDLPQAHFQAGTAVFLPSAYSSLDMMVELLAQYPALEIRIDGHVNGVGTVDCEHDRAQQALSTDRAMAVKQYLVRHGIAEERLSTKGWGCTRMIFPRASDEKEMAANRRVELVVQ